MDLLNRVIVPSILMVIASALLIKSVYQLRMGEFTEHLNQSNGNGNKEVRLAITSITLNIIYIFLTLPMPLALLFGDYLNDYFLIFMFYLFSLSYSLNFYILLVMNSLFRSEFFLIFRKIFEPFENQSLKDRS